MLRFKKDFQLFFSLQWLQFSYLKVQECSHTVHSGAEWKKFNEYFE